nr:neurogenic locus notch protein [Hymenolepis microstoma]
MFVFQEAGWWYPSLPQFNHLVQAMVSVRPGAITDIQKVTGVALCQAKVSASAFTSPSTCQSNPCLNNGKCEKSADAPGGYQCICPEPFGGKDCAVENPTCKDDPCLNRGVCEDLPNRQFRCSCPQEYTGLRCEFRNPCIVKPCKNGAQCFVNNLGTRQCSCQPGFTGEDCGIDINECEIGERSPCEHNGTCINESGGYRCVCLNEYTGVNCESRVLNCKPNPCQNGGICEEMEDGFECTCPHGYEGPLCQTNINDCVESPCQNGGVCEDLVGAFRCNCLPGWKGTLCEQRMLPCDFSLCQNNGTCSNTPDGEYVCECPPGFGGSRCEIDINECVGIRCENGGHCIDGQNSWYCQCRPGFTGRHCEQHIPVPVSAAVTSGFNMYTPHSIPCKDGKSCLHGGICVRSETTNFCECPFQWHGEFCEIPVCPEDFCANGGVCREILIHPRNVTLASQKEPYCECPTGYFGEHCLEKVTECTPGLCNHGKCVDVDGKAARCHCDVGFGGNQCERPLRSCLEKPCLNGAICLADPERLFICQCQPGFIGNYCESKIPCYGISCGSHGKCESDECICERGWSGPHCNISLPDPKTNNQTCEDAPCANHAQCLPLSQLDTNQSAYQFRCLCETALGNFTGEFCHEDIDECLKEPCRNGGECLNTPGSFICRCPVGFEGRFCEARSNPCDDTYGPVCANGGICSTVNGKAICRCPTGFSGSHCEVENNECAQKPCLNGGICVPFFGSYTCRCPADFSGRNCERSLAFSPCSNQTCQNGGYCKGSSFVEECHCPPGYYGRYCEVTLNLCHQLLEISLNADPVYYSASTLGRLLGSKRTLSLTAATSALLEDSGKLTTSMEVLNNLHLSRTSLGPCYPPGTQQCLPMRKLGDFECHCKHGFFGRYCEQRRDFCAEASQRLAGGGDICLNGGQCVNRPQGIENQFSNLSISNNKDEQYFVCQCLPGFSGPRCELRSPSCDDVDICQNGGVCAVDGSRLKCICPRGLGGTFCEIDLVNECEHAGNCLNGGSCLDGLGNYTCECPHDFCGARCELNGFACAIEATKDPKRWPGEAAEARLCEMYNCKQKAENGRCDLECDRFACGFDAGECLYLNRQQPQSLIIPVSNQSKMLSKALPWANCTVIQEQGIPCHLRFGDGKCDSACDSEACLFDGWDCRNENSTVFELTTKYIRMRPKKPVEGSLILLVGVPPSQFLLESKEKRELENRFLDGLGDLLKAKLRIRQVPKTGEPMVYPVTLTMVPNEDSGKIDNQRDAFWSISDFLNGDAVNMSVNRLIIEQKDEDTLMIDPAIKLSQVLSQLAGIAKQPRNQELNQEVFLSRRRREASETRIGSRVFLEFQHDKNQPMSGGGGSMFNNVESAAQFVSAALRTRRYTPPVDIFAVETATPETLQRIISNEGVVDNRIGFHGLPAPLAYCLIAVVFGLLLIALLGVLYGVMQRRAHTAETSKVVKTTSIWYPRNSSSRDSRQGGGSGGGGGGVFGCFTSLTDASGQMTSSNPVPHQQSLRNLSTPHSSSLCLWSREQALALGREKMAMRASPYTIPPSSGYSQVCGVNATNDGSMMSTGDVPSDTPLLLATANQMPQVDVKAYFTSLMECLVSGNGVTEPFTEGFSQKLEYLRNVELQQQQSEAASNMYRPGARKRTQTQSLLHQLLTSTLPETGETLLHLAARYNCANALTSLLNAGADPYAVDSQGQSVLLTAVSASAVDAARALLGSSQVASDMSRLFVACPTVDKTTALIQAVKVSDIEMVELLLQTMANLVPDPTSLQMPPGPGSQLPPGYPPQMGMQNRRPPPPQSMGPRLGYARLYPPSNNPGNSLMVNPGGGASADDGSGSGGLSTNSFGVNATDGEGRTALHWAALTEQPAMVQLLLRAGASHDVQTIHEETPLTFAAHEGSVEICSLLLAAGANIEIADYLDRTPKQLAAANGHTDVVQLLQVYSTAPHQHQQSSSHHSSLLQQQQQRYSTTQRRATILYPANQSFFQPQQIQQHRYYRPPSVAQNCSADGPSYEKRLKMEPPEYLSSMGEESFLMQLVPPSTANTPNSSLVVTSATTTVAENEGVSGVSSSDNSKATYFFEQPPLPPIQQQPQQYYTSNTDGLMTPVTTCQSVVNQSNREGGGGSGVVGKISTDISNNWTTVNQRSGHVATATGTTNGHTPSSDTESPAHWSSPSPTAISPPVAPLKMAVTNSGGQYQMSRVVSSSNSNANNTVNQHQGFCPNHGAVNTTSNTSNNQAATGGYSVAYSKDCIKLEPGVF